MLCPSPCLPLFHPFLCPCLSVLQHRTACLSEAELQQLRPFLGFDQVLTGLDQLLQLSMGLALRPRAAAAGEVWNDRVIVLELHAVGLPQHQQGAECEASAVARTLDWHAHVQQPQQQQPQQQQPQQQQQQCYTPESVGSRLLGTMYLDPAGGFSTQLLVYGSQYGSLWHQQQQRQATSSPSNSSNRISSSFAAPAVAVGLQSGGVLAGNQSQLALGLWELCHELGHAVNFILSAAVDAPDTQTPPEHFKQPPPGQPVPMMEATAGVETQQSIESYHKPYHLHAAWLPLELLELPSTLFESFCMDARCLQVLCSHQHTKEQLPFELAGKLARFIQDSHDNPLLLQHTVSRTSFASSCQLNLSDTGNVNIYNTAPPQRNS